MSMGTIGKAMKTARTRMIESEVDSIADDFTHWFGLRDGDYIRYRKTDQPWKQGRIMSVESVYGNQAGGVTADVTIAPLLVSGRLGKTRCLLLVVDDNGDNLRGVHFCHEVERVSQSRNHEYV